jgi:hypothetical protein
MLGAFLLSNNKEYIMALINTKYCWFCEDSETHIDGYCCGCERRAQRKLKKLKKEKARLSLVKRKSGVSLPRSYK